MPRGKLQSRGGTPQNTPWAGAGGEVGIGQEWESMVEYCRRIVSPFNIINSNGFIGGNLMI